MNQAFFVHLYFEPNEDVYTFDSSAFFPLDNLGWGNEGRNHNFHFTTEIHTTFHYVGGERFSFTGDDDLWVFINGHLAIDLGGLHPPRSMTIEIDALAPTLGLQPGSDYALDLFHAEHRRGASNFRVDTNLQFTNCGRVVPEQIF